MKNLTSYRRLCCIAVLLAAAALTSCAAGKDAGSGDKAVYSETENSGGALSGIPESPDGLESADGGSPSGSSKENIKTSAASTTGKPETKKTETKKTETAKPETAKPETAKAASTKAASAQKPQTSAPAPRWKESAASGTYYAAQDCSAREQAVIGSKAARRIRAGEKLTVTAKTDTGYYKLTDGLFVHSDYLTKTDPAAAATAPAAKAPASEAPSSSKKPQTSKAPSSSKKPQTSGSSAATPAPPSVPSQNGGTYNSAKAEEKEMFRLINEYRVKNGRSELKWDDSAYRAATIRVAELIPEWGGHTRPDGSPFQSVYDQLNVKNLKTMGENLAGGFASPKDTFEQWINSEGHRNNILQEKFKSGAIAFLSSPNDRYKYYWVQEFTAYFE